MAVKTNWPGASGGGNRAGGDSAHDSAAGPATEDAGALRRVIEQAKGNGYSLGDLTVLASQNDPYRVDTPAGHRNGAWVAEQLHRIGRERIHLRGLHYAIVARGDVIRPDGRIYVNDEEAWLWLQSTAAKAARWLGYVKFSAIVDERNAPPVIHRKQAEPVTYWVSVDVEIQIPSIDDLKPFPRIDGFVGRQPYNLVIVGEKASLAEAVMPIARRYEADLYLPTGEASDTMIYTIARDAAEDGRPLRLFYLADFDPAGFEMPSNLGRKLQALRDLTFHSLDFEVRSVALTPDQVQDLRLPSTPLKETERRADRWREAWGLEQTEIDALATLQPQKLASILRKALAPFYDADLAHRVSVEKSAWQEQAQSWLEQQMDLESLTRLQREAAERLDALKDDIAAINDGIRLAVGDDFTLPTAVVPEPQIDADLHGKPLVSSSWSWTDQTRALIARKSYGAQP
jgi:hypothetical protein